MSKESIRLQQQIDQHRVDAREWLDKNPTQWFKASTWIMNNLQGDGIESVVGKLATLKLCELLAEKRQ